MLSINYNILLLLHPTLALVITTLGAQMDSRIKQLNSIVAALIFCIAAYSLSVVINSIDDAYQNWSTFFDRQGSLYPTLITLITALVPVSAAIISYLVYVDMRTYIILLPTVHVLFFLPSYVSYGMVFLILIW
ncbi:MAG: hypothetical protein ACI93R_003073 [Flavobacteriales bacterium]|jgi:hypothetical protein